MAQDEMRKVIFEGEELEVESSLLEEEPETEPESDEGKPSDKGHPEKPGDPETKLDENFLKKYKGKSSDELLAIIAEKEKFIGQQSNKIGKDNLIKKEVVRDAKFVKDEINKLNSKKDTLKKRMEKLDVIDDIADYDRIEKEIENIEDSAKKMAEEVETLEIEGITTRKLNETFNSEFLVKAKQNYEKDFGVQFDEEAWDIIGSFAKKLTGETRINENSLEAAMVYALGKDKYRSTLQGEAALKARKDISEAGKLKDNHITSKNSSSVDYDALSDRQKTQVNKKMTPKQLIAYFKKEHGYDITKN